MGHSWGGPLAIEYMLTRPEGVRSVVFVGPMLSTPRWVEEAADLIGQLPPSQAEALRQGEAHGVRDAQTSSGSSGQSRPSARRRRVDET